MFFFIGFALIGVVIGVIAEKYMSDKRSHSPLTMVLAGVVGALIGGSLTLWLFRYGRAGVSQSRFEYGGTREIGQATVPADWLSLFAAIMVSVLVVACYKLAKPCGMRNKQ